MRKLLISSVAAFTLAAGLLSCSGAKKAEKSDKTEKSTENAKASDKKNVLVFIVDDLGYHDLSSKGSKLYETPNIDALSKQGVDFSNAYVSHPRCLPSRFALQTSNYPGAHGIPGGGDVGEVMSDGRTIGQVFKDNGYETFFAGKWHLGKTEEAWPQNRGYDINVAGCSAGAPISYFFPYNTPQGKADKYDPKNKGGKGHGKKITGLEKGVKGEYITDRLTDETIKFLKKDHKKPFFAILNHYGVHTPLQAPKDMVKKYRTKLKGMDFEGPEFMMKDGETKLHQDNAIYAAMIESVDNSLGKLIQTLKDEGLYENTIIVFSSDHGGLSNRGIGNKRQIATSNLPLRAGKGHIYEGGIKVPFIIGGAVTNDRHVCNEVTSNIDLMPTLVDLCGLKQPNYKVDGVSMAQFINNTKTTERTLFWHSPRARLKSTGDNYCTVIRVGDYKLFDFYKDGKVELYNVVKDPNETNNIAEQNKELVAKLQKEINDWKKEVKAVK